ncbi:MAG TPA: hypothetical protein VNS58_05230 [Puia sp.]|nr:hypothetical protein [Puia sp.]
MRYLLLISSLIIQLGCTSAYRNLQHTTGDPNNLQRFKPVITTALYKIDVNVIGKYLSGLLLLKTMPDSSLRMVFSNEMGFKFFDFEFAPGGRFKVNYIISKMNKKPVIKTLRKDFELVLMQSLDPSTAYILKDSSLLYYVFPRSNGFYYYITNPAGDELVRMERSSKRKPVVEAIMKDYHDGIPDTIGITHKTFHFTIGLKKIVR